jgi:phosphate transport system substrate-binding protein
VLARIFQGIVTRWDDAFIQRENPDVILPSADIIPVHRSDGSGTTHLLTNFLSVSSPESWTGDNNFKGSKWARRSMEAKGNEALAEAVSENQYSIGYVEFEYAHRKKLVTANIQIKWTDPKCAPQQTTNTPQRTGSQKPCKLFTEFVEPSIETIQAAVPKSAVGDLAEPQKEASDLQEKFPQIDGPANSEQPRPYPISGFTWLVLKPLKDKRQLQDLCKFIEFLPGWAEKNAQILGYAPLPEGIVAENARKLSGSGICPLE